MDKKRIPSVKKVSLAGLSEAWDESCYAYVVPSGYEDQLALTRSKVSEKTREEQIEYQVGVVKNHFVSGKIKAFNGEDFELVDMEAADGVASIEIADCLYANIMGLDVDPKAIRKEVLDTALQLKNESNTETSSSEESPATSPTK